MKVILYLALAAVCLAPVSAFAADSASVTITSPTEGLTIASRSVTVEATFTAPGKAVIELVELWIDGVTVDARKIDPPAEEGTITFTWLASDYANGKHRLAVRAIDSNGKATKAQIAVVLRATGSLRDSAVRIVSPAEGETVSGSTNVQVEVDNQALARYVIFLVDDVLKAISNVRPFTYAWDTTRYLNGIHILKIQACSGGDWEAMSLPVQVQVDNPSGATAMKEPRLAMSPVSPAPAAPPTRSSETPLPPPVRAESPAPVYPEASLPGPALAVPGTAPFISPSGDLITPPLDFARDEPTPAPVEIAVLPTFAESPSAPSAPVALAQMSQNLSLATAMPSVPVTPLEMAGVSAAESAVVAMPPSDSAAAAAHEPAQAPLQVAMLPIPETPAPAEPAPAALPPAETIADVVELAPAPADESRVTVLAEPVVSELQIAMLPPTPASEPVAESAPVALPPAERTADVAEVPPAQAADAQLLEPAQPAASELQIAMLPPMPFEAAPSPKLTAEPAPTQITCVMRTSGSLTRIATELGVPAIELAEANGLDAAAIIHVGQRLAVPSLPISFDGRPMAFDAPAVIADSRAIVALRTMIEQAGGQVIWDSKQRQARAAARGHQIAVTIGSDQARVDGGAVTMTAAAQLRCDRTVVPLRFIGDALDLALQYQDGIIHIASAQK